jgi:hypothetical protein
LYELIVLKDRTPNIRVEEDNLFWFSIEVVWLSDVSGNTTDVDCLSCRSAFMPHYLYAAFSRRASKNRRHWVMIVVVLTGVSKDYMIFLYQPSKTVEHGMITHHDIITSRRVLPSTTMTDTPSETDIRNCTEAIVTNAHAEGTMR